jgi:hypothetical protein
MDNIIGQNLASSQADAEDPPWCDLARLCRAIRNSWYPVRGTASGERYARRLGRILERIPDDDQAIIRQEALAWLHQLRGDYAAAIRHRREEIRLIEFLHGDVQRSLESGEYDHGTARYALQGRELRNLRDRRAILRALEEEASASDNPPAG